jgi:FkbM family methyltransferase
MSLKRILKGIFINQYRNFGISGREFIRLSSLPRYNTSKTTFLGKEISIVDSMTFLSGVNEIFRDNIFQFNSSNDYPLIIDCGSNIGLSVIYFKTKFPKSRILAFEPDPDIFNVLKKNINSYNFKQIELYNKAIWDQNTTVQFYSEGAYSGRIAEAKDNLDLINVKTERLKDLLQEPVEFLKLDIEGAEFKVLKDCSSSLNNIKYIFLEYHSHITEEQRLDEVLNILKLNGFRYYIKEAFLPKNPFIKTEDLAGMDLQLNIFCKKI